MKSLSTVLESILGNISKDLDKKVIDVFKVKQVSYGSWESRHENRANNLFSVNKLDYIPDHHEQNNYDKRSWRYYAYDWTMNLPAILFENPATVDLKKLDKKLKALFEKWWPNHYMHVEVGKWNLGSEKGVEVHFKYTDKDPFAKKIEFTMFSVVILP